MQHQALAPYGWSDRWAALLADHPGCEPARVVRHDGSGLLLATNDGIVAAPLTRRLDPAPTVGDWIACDGTDPVAVLERVSLLTRRRRGRTRARPSRLWPVARGFLRLLRGVLHFCWFPGLAACCVTLGGQAAGAPSLLSSPHQGVLASTEGVVDTARCAGGISLTKCSRRVSLCRGSLAPPPPPASSPWVGVRRWTETRRFRRPGLPGSTTPKFLAGQSVSVASQWAPASGGVQTQAKLQIECHSHAHGILGSCLCLSFF